MQIMRRKRRAKSHCLLQRSAKPLSASEFFSKARKGLDSSKIFEPRRSRSHLESVALGQKPDATQYRRGPRLLLIV